MEMWLCMVNGIALFIVSLRFVFYVAVKGKEIH
jgi:hypothetical protein